MLIYDEFIPGQTSQETSGRPQHFEFVPQLNRPQLGNLDALSATASTATPQLGPPKIQK